MRDVACSHCGEPNDVFGLRDDSIGYWGPDDADALAPLGTFASVVDYLVSRGARRLPELVQRIADDPFLTRPDDRPLTVAELFDYWHNNIEVDGADPRMKAAKLVVQTAVYFAVMSGKGCPTCGFAHDGPGRYRVVTAWLLVHGNVTDDDPAMFMVTDEDRAMFTTAADQ